MATLKRYASKVITLPNGHSPINSLKIIHLIIPVHSPESGWNSILQTRFDEFAGSLDSDSEVEPLMIVDGPVSGQVKNEIEAFASNGWKVLWLAENIGKGEALRRGAQSIKGHFMLFTDVDMPYSTSRMKTIVHSLLAGSDLAFGRRDSKYLQALPFQRRLISILLKAFNKYILRLKHPDTQCGLKGFSAKGKQCLIATKTKSFSFDIELAVIASKQKDFNWTAVDVELRKGVIFRDMNFAILKHELRNLWRIIKK